MRATTDGERFRVAFRDAATGEEADGAGSRIDREYGTHAASRVETSTPG